MYKGEIYLQQDAPDMEKCTKVVIFSQEKYRNLELGQPEKKKDVASYTQWLNTCMCGTIHDYPKVHFIGRE
jgi:hypothetical protein